LRRTGSRTARPPPHPSSMLWPSSDPISDGEPSYPQKDDRDPSYPQVRQVVRHGDQVARDDVRMSAEPFSQCLEAQAAAIARRQGQDVGVDPETMRTRVRSGRWQRLQRGVYAAFSGDPVRETVLWAALLRAGPGAVLSHQTAA